VNIFFTASSPASALDTSPKPMPCAPCPTAPGIGGHDQHDIAEIDRLAVVIGQAAIVHHLQQDVEQIGMGLLDFVEQQHAMRLLVDRIGQQAALIIADIARRRADQAADRVTLHIFRHVEALDRDAHDRSASCLRHFGLADAGRAGEQEELPIGLSGSRRPAPLTVSSRWRQHFDRLVLAEDDALQVLLEMLERASCRRLKPILGGMRAMVAMTCSISRAVMVFLRFDGGTSICIAPTSSITSIALSGSLRSLM
jgi:hypothetical protein